MSFFTVLDAAPAAPLDPARSRIFSARAALPCLPATISIARARWSRDILTGRAPDMWRYRELLPLFDGEAAGHAGRGIHAAVPRRLLGATLGLDRLYIKDESLNPTNSFKARGQSAAITRARSSARRRSRCRPPAMPATRRRPTRPPPAWHAKVFIPQRREAPFVDECRLYGANVTLVDGLITDAGRIAAEQRRAARLV